MLFRSGHSLLLVTQSLSSFPCAGPDVHPGAVAMKRQPLSSDAAGRGHPGRASCTLGGSVLGRGWPPGKRGERPSVKSCLDPETPSQAAVTSPSDLKRVERWEDPGILLHQGWPRGLLRRFRRQWTSPHPGLCALMAAAVCLGCSVQDLTPPCGQPEETAGQLGPGCLAASAMTAGQGLGAWFSQLWSLSWVFVFY